MKILKKNYTLHKELQFCNYIRNFAFDLKINYHLVEPDFFKSGFFSLLAVLSTLVRCNMSDTDNLEGTNVDPETQEMLRSFVSEAFDSLDTNEPIVEDLREENNEESVNAIFRVFHTLKGLSGFFEMKVINRVTHEAETLLDIMRKQNQPQSEDTITVIYQTFDFLRDLLQRVSTDFTDISGNEEAEDMILIVKDCLNTVQGGDTAPIEEISEDMDSEIIEEIPDDSEIIEEIVDETEQEPNLLEDNSKIDIDLDQDTELADLLSSDMFDQYSTNSYELLDIIDKNLLELEKDPTLSSLVQETFGAIHSLKGNSGFMGFSEIEEISMDVETILDSIRNNELDIDQNIISVLLSQIEQIRNRIDAMVEKVNQQNAEETQEDSKPKDKTAKDNKPETAKEETKEKNINKEKAAKEAKEKKSKPAASKAQPAKKQTRMPAMQRKDIRVETNKIDKLFDLVGELITIETMVTNNVDLKGLDLPNFSKSANMLNKITRELQEISMSIRMMPLEGLFNKMKRLVRDVSIKMGKKVDFSISGQETEMDKNVIDEIADPLVHILRNAIDHGIEPPEDRITSGKDETGKVSLSARYEGNEILIIVKDDGKGINREAVLKKAMEKGLINSDPELMSNREIAALIFEPGFSTAQEVTDISGRGVGMDVVKKNIEKLRGSVTVDTEQDRGSVITLRIPLTLAIMEAMLIRIGESIFALPILALQESFRTQKGMITKTMDGLEVVKVREEVMPVIRLHELFNINTPNKNLDDGLLIMIEHKEKQMCLFADEIIGQQQAVIKGLSDYIGKVPGITGCMITGDGGIGLIIDLESLVIFAENPEIINEMGFEHFEYHN